MAKAATPNKKFKILVSPKVTDAGKAKELPPILTPADYTRLVKESNRQGKLLTLMVRIPPETAAFILAEHNKRNRSIRSQNVAAMSRDIKNSKWAGHVGDEITVCDDGNIGNGQHRLYGAVDAGVTLIAMMSFGISEEARLKEGTGSQKSAVDAFKGRYGKHVSAQSSLLRLFYGFLGDQSRPQVYSGNYKPTMSEMLSLDDVFGAGLYESLIFIKKHNLGSVTVDTNAALVHFLIKQSKYGFKADSFFEQLGTGTNLSSTDPVHVIRNRLIMDSVGKKALRQQHSKDSAIGLLVKAWNATLESKSWSSKERTPDNMLPIKGLTNVGGVALYQKPTTDNLVDDMFS
jgi:hypothetical protein